MAFANNTLVRKNQNCAKNLNKTLIDSVSEKYCRGTFDGWLCWNDTPADTTAYQPCPDFVIGFDSSRYAFKICNKDGEWFRHPITNKTWSNYTTCVNIDEFQWKHGINILNELGYGISLIAIFLSLSIFLYFKSLRCARITLHINLLISFGLNNLLWLIWYWFVIPDIQLLERSPNICVVLHLAIQYFLLTNYSWMLCEGFYLHTVLVSAFISEKLLVYWLMGLGWSSPLVIVIVYGLMRRLYGNQEHHQHCWMDSSSFDTIFIVPVCFSMLLNFLFLCNIIRVLLLKASSPISLQGNSRASRPTLQAFRATLLLVPLLGLQYVATPFRPDHGHPWEHFYDIIAAITSSFQGLCVAIFFCFLNGEVLALIRRKWRTFCISTRTRANSYTATQVSLIRYAAPTLGDEKISMQYE